MKKAPLKTFLVFKNGVKSIQTTVYNGARTVNEFAIFVIFLGSFEPSLNLQIKSGPVVYYMM